MGRRKERRLAALSGAGRRVKLDLFAEPSGDLGGSSVHEQVGGDNERAQSSGVPNSPSSSGQDTQNPLLLLGQYSDEDLDEQSSQKPSNSIAENKDSEPTDQEETPGEVKDTGASATEDLTDWKIEQQDGEKDVGTIPLAVVQIQETGAAREGDDMSGSDVTAAGNTCEGTALADQISVSAPTISEMSLGWRVVMHEESGQYYYWNVETGETSWDVPDALAQTSQLTSHLTTSVTENAEGTDVVAKESSSTVGIELHNSSAGLTSADSVATQMLPPSKEWHENDPQVDGWAKGYKNETLAGVVHVHQIEPECELTSVSTSSHDNGFVEGAVPGDDQYRCADLSANLVKQCQCLLDRLNSLQGYRSCLKTHERMSKYVQEVEVRLSDIDSLQSHGTSLLPFWLHSEKRLKHLEDSINNEIYQLAVSAQMEDHVDDSSSKKEKNMENLGHESEMDRNEEVRKSEFSHASTSVENDALNEAVYLNAVDATHALSFQSPSRHLESGEVVREMNGAYSLGPDLHVEEDIDMDVDMDVEDEVPATITTSTNALIAKDSGLTEQLIKPNPPVEKSSLVSTVESTVFHPPQEDWIPPPPPDDEPVPPPPPDNEPVPPPPPDEPPEPLYPPLSSYAETAPSLSYTEQYNLTYPDPTFQYYGHVPTSNFYGHVDGSQVALDNGMLYYEAVPNTYTETAPVLVAPIDPAAYYNVHEGSVLPVPVVAGTDSSQLHIESAPAELLPSMKVDVSAIGVPSAIVATEAPAIANATESASAPSTDTAAAAAAAAAVAASSTAAKVQPKVMRTKKRAAAAAPSLRSNKRVSTLVDQWKAAKEEMRKDEEKEQESAHETLEKKRQREIEEWRAKHIASGEARGNANFQPLGGDWRKRVKRRQAQAAQEAREKTPEPTKNDTPRQEDLAEFSTGLPSGWKAYYDDASKQVYYANLITSETTWTKPTR